MIKLYDYWRSSAAYRLRIAFNLKGIEYASEEVNIHPDVSAQKDAEYRQINPQMRVPTLAVEGQVFGQSMAILEWLEETYPTPPLLPEAPFQRLRARAFADTIACDIHPLNNLSVLGVLRSDFAADDQAIAAWYGDWIIRGFTALEALSEVTPQGFLYGERPGLAEVCLVPQMANARRFKVDVSAFPKLTHVDETCRALPAFEAAAPENVKP